MSGNRKGQENFNSVVSSALQNSMVAGLPQIAGPGNIIKKFLRAFVFLLCMAGFIYQSMIFLNLYFEFHTVTDVQVTNSREINLPAFTICNQNGIYQSLFCEKYKPYCKIIPADRFEEDICKCYSRYCENGVPQKSVSIINPSLTTFLIWMPLEALKDYQQPFRDLLTDCYMFLTHEGEAVTECDLSNIQSVKSTPRSLYRNVCYTMFGLVGQPDKKPKSVKSLGYVVLSLDPRPFEYATVIPEVAVQIGFHEARSLANPYMKGTEVTDKTENTFILKKVVKNLLPAPYETNCVDYVKRWEENGGQGPLNEVECIQTCLINTSVEAFQCIVVGITYPTNETTCQMKYINEELINSSRPCLDTCGPACWQEIYELEKVEAPLEEQGKSKAGFKMKGRITVNVKFHNMETTTYNCKPQFEEIEIFSYVGGYAGMWLGISLLAVFDFVETLIILGKYPLLKLRRFLRNRKEKKAWAKRVVRY